jgi:DNA-damage-inducible protein D
MTPGEYKQFKGLERENLRDHMTDLELIFSMLGDAATTDITRKKNTQGFNENKHAACKGGRIAGNAREKIETETGSRV